MAIFKDVAVILGLKYDNKKTLAWGVHRGFSLVVEPIMSSKKQRVSISLCACAMGMPMQHSGVMSVVLPNKVERSADGYRINMQFEIAGKHDDNVVKVADCVRLMIDYLLANSAVNCDEKGVEGATNLWRVKGKYAFLSEMTAQQMKAGIQQSAAVAAQQKENYVLGCIGALLGALVGALAILLIARLGFISSLGSIAMGLAVVFGYKKFGKKFSMVGLIVSVVISAAMTFVTFNVDAAIDLHKAFVESGLTEFTFGYCVTNVKLLFTLIDAMDIYWKNLILMMLVGVAGAAIYGWLEYTEEKKQFEMYQLV
ncbi:MAG: hypothetical protein IJX63_04270 [Lachnospiraceae bacterium]|nr:hypothetical protein [Lachnospiraceae bacterium]